MPKPVSYTVEVADWLECRAAIEQVRRTVFIDEQRIPEHEEWDAVDPVATHVLAYVAMVAAKRDAVGTGRLEPTGKIGRVAVLPQYRGIRAGVAIMRHLIDLASERGFTEVHLNAQTSARGFYERLGFQAEGPEFDEVGIPHQRMRRPVGKSDGQQAGHGGYTEHSVESR